MYIIPRNNTSILVLYRALDLGLSGVSREVGWDFGLEKVNEFLEGGHVRFIGRPSVDGERAPVFAHNKSNSFQIKLIYCLLKYTKSVQQMVGVY